MHETADSLVCGVCSGAVSQECSPVNEWTELGVHSYYLMAVEGSCAASILHLFWATVLLIPAVFSGLVDMNYFLLLSSNCLY